MKVRSDDTAPRIQAILALGVFLDDGVDGRDEPGHDREDGTFRLVRAAKFCSHPSTSN
jgi:hypothetical protein